MKLEHRFEVPLDADRAFTAIGDLPLMAACMPGASLDEVRDREFTGTISLKVGPIKVTYRGAGDLLEWDSEARRAVVVAKGSQTQGAGSAEARIEVRVRTGETSMSGTPTSIAVVDTDLNVTGRPAQFGGSVLSDVGERILTQFAANLAEAVAADRIGEADLSDRADDGTSLDVLSLLQPRTRRLVIALAVTTALALGVGFRRLRRQTTPR